MSFAFLDVTKCQYHHKMLYKSGFVVRGCEILTGDWSWLRRCSEIASHRDICNVVSFCPGEIGTKTGWHVTNVTNVTIVTCNCCVRASHLMLGLVLMIFEGKLFSMLDRIFHIQYGSYGEPGLCNGVLISVMPWLELISIPKMSLHLDIVSALTSVIMKHIAVTISNVQHVLFCW